MAKGSTVLKKITAEAKRIQKRNPKTAWKSAVKQAGAKYRSGKLKPARKKAAPKKRAVRRVIKKKVASKKIVRRKRSSSTLLLEKGATRRTKPRVYRVKRTKKGTYSGTRRIGSSKSKTMKILLFSALGLGAIYLMTRKSGNNTVYVPTGNSYRDNNAQQILSYVAAAGATAAQIAALIQSLNKKSDAQIEQDRKTIEAGGNIAYA